ncbi:MAG: hypothetical protein IKQ04_04825 [Oscillospiraceae bacterium]|nr:hypothetical protein [Oscillospiraceae bacterium]
MWFGILIAVVAIGIGAALGMKQAKQNKQLISEGKMIRRDLRFAEKGEEFTSRVGSYKALADKISSMYSPCKIEGNASTQVVFTGSTYAARLYKLKFDEPSGIGIFRFEFTHWKSSGGVYENVNAMNVLMTSVEKCFLELDPNTGVRFYDLDFKTKHKVF